MASFNLSSSLPNISGSSMLPSNVSSVLPSNVSSMVPTNTGSIVSSTSLQETIPPPPPSAYFSDISHTDHTDTNENIVSDINSLQDIEKKLFQTLETNTELTSEEYEDIIQKINSISQMRLKLYETLSNVNSLYKNTVTNSQETLYQQLFAIGIVERQLNDTKEKLNELELAKNNKIRLVKINDYYGDKYSEHTILMKYIIIMLVPIIILSFMFNKGLIPSFLFYILLIIITIIGSIFIVNRLISIWSRDNMNYQEYAWNFNAKNAPGVSKGDNGDPWLSNSSMGICIGDNCCTDGMVYDPVLDKCVFDDTREITESFINNVLTQKSGLTGKKPDVTLNSTIMPSNF